MTHAILFKNNAGRIGYKTTSTDGKSYFIGHKTWVNFATAMRRMKQMGWTFSIE